MKTIKIQCHNCKQVIFSRYPGEWISCNCWENTEENRGSWIDQKGEYVRYGGGPFTELEIENE